jgi:hypothetical protein
MGIMKYLNVNEPLGTYRGKKVYLVSESKFEEMDYNDNFIFAVYQGDKSCMPLIEGRFIIDKIDSQGNLLGETKESVEKSAKKKKQPKKQATETKSEDDLDLQRLMKPVDDYLEWARTAELDIPTFGVCIEV